MKVQNSVVLITGANRGLGLAFAREALARGAKKVYAGAREPASVALAGVQPVKLDVTNPQDVDRVARELGDVTLLINNAGIADLGGFLKDGSVEAARRQMETNYFGPLMLSKAFAGVLADNGGGAIVNVLSAASWISSPMLSVYGSTKAAAWGLTNGLRQELLSQKTQVLGLHVGFIDTDLVRGLDVEKISPELVVQRTLDGLEAGAEEVLADEKTQFIKKHLSAERGVYLQSMGG